MSVIERYAYLLKRASATVAMLALFSSSCFALSVSELTNQDANSGLKAALETGSAAAVAKLGAQNGFLNNDKVKIKLPAKLDKLRSVLKMTGQANKLDDLEVAMNHAAESAIPLAKPLLFDAIKSMTLTDAKNILTGGDTAVTDFFKQKTSEKLTQQFLPKVKTVTDKSDVSQKYNAILDQAKKYGVAQEQDATVEGFVTKKAVDGLYVMIAEEEKAIRKDPIGTGSKIIGKVFGALK